MDLPRGSSRTAPSGRPAPDRGRAASSPPGRCRGPRRRRPCRRTPSRRPRRPSRTSAHAVPARRRRDRSRCPHGRGRILRGASAGRAGSSWACAGGSAGKPNPPEGPSTASIPRPHRACRRTAPLERGAPLRAECPPAPFCAPFLLLQRTFLPGSRLVSLSYPRRPTCRRSRRTSPPGARGRHLRSGDRPRESPSRIAASLAVALSPVSSMLPCLLQVGVRRALGGGRRCFTPGLLAHP